MKRYTSLALCVAVLLTCTSCTRKISPNIYKASAVGEASKTYRGRVINVRQVQVDESEHPMENKGTMLGALGGGLIGSQIGGGFTANLIGAGVGALAGGIGGGLIGDQLGKQEGMEYTVELTDGRIMTVVQGPELVFQVGQYVLVIVSKDGRSRIVPDQTGGQNFYKKDPKEKVIRHIHEEQ